MTLAEQILRDVREYVGAKGGRVAIVEDPSVRGVYAVRYFTEERGPTDVIDFLWRASGDAGDALDRLEEVTFTMWPPAT